ncbi:MAG: glycoside hydrolase family 127 protein [Verrucomicrobia bacterium]|nr:glycoside hydrolase family 127 protein [Verrucomicrobiota bacterium]MDA1087106.1 glycoside hydrolase family 127 protein [Verrucomicrobiota bacterium]
MTAERFLQKVPFTSVTLTGGLWKGLMETNREQTLPIQYEQCLKTGRLDAFKQKERTGCGEIHIFWDSDVAKWIEAAAYSLATHPDPKLERKVDGVIRDMSICQAPDGYLNSHYQKYRIKERWTNLRDNHELYCAGHLMEAAVAYWQATGKRAFLEVMIRYADHIDSVFGPCKGQLKGYPGHEEIELGLVKMYEATGEKRYLKLASFFVDERGRTGRGKPRYFDLEAEKRGEAPKGFHFGTHEDNQSHLPVREQKEIVGHAVRALYLYSGMADVAAQTGDKDLLSACKVLWKNLATKRMAITGGVGPRAQNEGMTSDYDLPTEGAYLETCAAVALVFWAHRLFLATCDGAYLDVMEKALYNGTISGVDRKGTHFYYGNPLAVHPGFDGNGVYHQGEYHYRRVPWFGCACCPTNLARMIAQFPGYLYAVRGKSLFVGLYADARATLNLGGTEITLTQKTDYPWDGIVEIVVDAEVTRTWTLALRVPAWCRGAALRVNGKRVDAPLRKGFLMLKREWRRADKVRLELPMSVEQIAVHPKARQVTGQVALQRGPVVYCLEEADNGADLANVFLPKHAVFRMVKGPASLGGVPCISATAHAEDTIAWRDTLYAPRQSKMVKRPIKAIPYFLWANRTPGEMTVFVKGA